MSADAPDPLNRVERLLPYRGRAGLGPVVGIVLKIMGVEVPPQVSIGARFRLAHGAPGLVIHPDTVIGDDVKVYQGVTIGRSDTYLRRDQVERGGGVTLGDRVMLGAHAVVLFRGGQHVSIGDDAVVGANAVVTADVPPGEIWAGNPARAVGRNPNAAASGTR